MQHQLQHVREVDQSVGVFVVPIRPFNVLEMEPFDVHFRAVVVRAEIFTTYARDIDFIKYGVIRPDNKIFLTRIDRNLKAGLLRKVTIMLRFHNVF